jgi:hypothetical protein
MDRNRLPRTRNTRLSDELRRQGRQPKWFCQQMGVSYWTFYRVESGITYPPDGWYERAAKVLGVQPEAIAPEEDGVAA